MKGCEYDPRDIYYEENVVVWNVTAYNKQWEIFFKGFIGLATGSSIQTQLHFRCNLQMGPIS